MNQQTTRYGLIDRLREVVGTEGLVPTGAEMQPYLESWRDNWIGRAQAVVRPRSTEETAAVVRLCAAAGTPIVPQGGRTGVTGASQPSADNSEVVLSLERMNAIRGIDLANDTMTVQAGCVLADIRAAAATAGRLFPLNFGAVGSAMIGGNISTNAGGINVLRYGNTRNLVSGLEVVLADGRVWDGLRGLRKDNAGYDLKQIFIGAEGTLGIITAAVLRLSPQPKSSLTALFAVATPELALAWLIRAKEVFSDQLTAFELIARTCIEATVAHIAGTGDPLDTISPWYVLLEVAGQSEPSDLQSALEDMFEAGFAAGEVSDGVIASSGQQADMLWRLRESIPEAHKALGRSFKHDVSVPISKVPEFLARAQDELQTAFPGIRMFTFGHLGDGNLHFNPLAPPGSGTPADLSRVNRIVHDLVVSLGGSISAEHGIGRLRRDELQHYKSDVEYEMMRKLKGLFDPLNILNPGKVVGPA